MERHVFKFGVAYAVVAWVAIEVADTTFPLLQLPEASRVLDMAMAPAGYMPHHELEQAVRRRSPCRVWGFTG